MDNYITCIGKIKFHEKYYDVVKYDALHNSDKLHRMKISHDTLLEYGLEIIEKYDLLKQMIIDKYPYIFIDEYQDTDEHVVKIMSKLQSYSEKIGHKIFVGYFGDSAQNIYQKGVGGRIKLLHQNLKGIDKEFNRRSTQEIITIANNIRNDAIRQDSIYEDCYGGSVKFYKGKWEDIDEFINKYVKQWEATESNPVHCFMLRNKDIARYNHFENIYNLFGQTGAYSGANYEQLNTELLSKDLAKLGAIPRLFFNILELYIGIQDERTFLKKILPSNVCKVVNIDSLKNLINSLKQINGKNLEELIGSVAELYSKDQVEHLRAVMDNLFGDMQDISVEKFKVFLLRSLFPNVKDDKIEEANTVINNLLLVNIEEYILWYQYISDEETGNVRYHTYHGTKGLEFDNILVIMENKFGKRGNTEFFDYFFSNAEKPESDIADMEKYDAVKNLLYVSVTRAIQNLRILYIDDVSTFESGIKKIFGEIHPFKSKLYENRCE